MNKPRSEFEWENWKNLKSRSTIDNYDRYLKRFCEHHDITLEDIFKIKLENEKAPDPRDRTILEKMVRARIHATVDSVIP